MTKTTKNIHGVDYILETGRLANLTNAAVLATAGETVVLTTVTVGPENPDLDYFPLGVEYVEKLYAAGMISSSRFIKREGKPTDKEILAARLLDRGVRSLMPEEMTNEVQIITQVLSYDHKNSPELLQYLAASSSLLIAGLPFKGPVAIVRSGMIDGKLIYNIDDDQMKVSDMNLMVSVTKDAVVSIEADAKLVKEDILSEVLQNSIQEAQDFFDLQNEFLQKAGKKEFTFNPRVISPELLSKVREELGSDFEELVFIKDKNERHEKLNARKKLAHEKLDEEHKSGNVNTAIDLVIKEIVRRNALENKKRIDGRALDELRPISAEVGVLPRVHGSAIFNRGETQVMSIVTLGSKRAEQMLEGIDGEGSKKYMHHYNFPGYSVGEVDRKFGMANRRAIGHGMIGEKSLLQVLPEDLKYTIRVVSEVLSSNGSTSMAATCGSTLALMDAGIQIDTSIAGISMGLVYDDVDKYVLFTDIIGDEDHYGDMDFKITGSRDGWTAIQLDNKLAGIPVDILLNAIAQSKKTRLKILDMMQNVISEPKKELSQYAPRITTIKIKESQIGELIGPGGKNIKEITAESGADIEIEDDGTVNITAVDRSISDKAIVLIKQILNDYEPGTVFDAIVKRVEAYGAFIDVNKNFGGLVHVSQLADDFVKDPNQIVKIGDKVKVKFIGSDDQGRNNFSMKGV